ncbi:hypothetical protein NDU88_006012 [Pleurodeles waltl]|uniref:Coiled-coil domain-containing protein 178 n=1 Tax=Pleurodeles waltl TaxID=8319 RepID=A0AAV7UJP5_PLEWA|nr:hypothetical protein NDU88_006012 [Pleurodeles waltl]
MRGPESGYVMRCQFRSNLQLFFMEKHASELIQLELLLMTEEMERIWSFFESLKVKTEDNLGNHVSGSYPECYLKAQPDVVQQMSYKRVERWEKHESTLEWSALLEDLATVHKRAKETLFNQHLEEIKNMGLKKEQVMPNTDISSLKEITTGIISLTEDLKKVYCQEQVPFEKVLIEENKDQRDEIVQVEAFKLVKQEHLKHIRAFRIMDIYSKLQCHGLPEDALKNTNNLPQCTTAEEVARAVSQRTEEKQIRMVAEFLQKYQKPSSSKGNPTEALLAEPTAIEPRLKMELRAETEEVGDLKAGEQSSLLQILEISAETASLFVDLHQSVKLVQLKEHQLQDIARVLKESCRDKTYIQQFVDEANCLANELREFREQSLRMMKENLIGIAEDKRRRAKIKRSLYKNCKVHALSLYLIEKIKRTLLGAEDERQKEMLETVQLKQCELERSYKHQISEERLKLQDQLERGELSGAMKKKLIKEHDETVAFLKKTFRHEVENVKKKLVYEKKKKEREEERNLSPTRSSFILEKDQQIEQRVLSLLTESKYSCA